MKTLYFECNMGAAGDMIMAALLDIHPRAEEFIERLNALNIPNVEIKKEVVKKCGIQGCSVSVLVGGCEEEDIHNGSEHIHSHNHGHEHGHLHEHEHSHNHERENECMHGHGYNQGHEHEHPHNHGHGHSRKHEHGHKHEGFKYDDTYTHEADVHTHTGMEEISQIINCLNVSERVKKDSLAVYNLIAEAEGRAHGVKVEQIHFHEVGMMDAVADIVGVCMLIEELAPEKIIASHIHVGRGQVKCAHGVLPVPAPATAYILRGIPMYGGEIRGELCTPTGAALLKYFAEDFAPMPAMKVSEIGYGMGKREFQAADGKPILSAVRTFAGEEASVKAGAR